MSVTQQTTWQHRSDHLRCTKCDAVLSQDATICGTCGAHIEHMQSSSSLNTAIGSRYRITTLLRSQPYMRLFIASDTLLHRPVVIRDIDVTRLEERAQRKAFATVRAEHDALHTLSTPYLMSLTDIRFSQGHIYSIAEQPADFFAPQVDSHIFYTLDHLLQSGIGLPDEQIVIAWICYLCQALDRLHARQIVIGDIDSHTIIINANDYEGQPALCVAWLPQMLRQLLPSTERASHFSAPEVLRGESSPTSDVYSLGALLYLLLTGSTPVARPRQHLLRPPHELNSHISTGISAIVMRALAWKREERYQSVRALVHELLHLSEQRPPIDEAQSGGNHPLQTSLNRLKQRSLRLTGRLIPRKTAPTVQEQAPEIGRTSPQANHISAPHVPETEFPNIGEEAYDYSLADQPTIRLLSILPPLQDKQTMKKADEAPTTPQPLEDIAEITAATDSDTAEDNNGNGHTPTIQLTRSIKKHQKMDDRKPPIDSETAVSESASTEQAIRSEGEVEETELQEISETTAETQDIEETETTEKTKKEDITKEEIIEAKDAEKAEAEDTTAANDVEEADTQTEDEIEETTTAQDIEEVEVEIAIEAQDPSEIEQQESEEDQDSLEEATEGEKKTAAIQATAETIETDPTEITEVENTEEVEEATATQGAITEAEEEETTTIQAAEEVEETEVREQENDEEDDTQRLRVLPIRPGQTPVATQPKTEAKDDEDLSLIETQSLLRTPASANTEQARLDQQSASKSISSNEPIATVPTKHQSVEQDTDQPDVIENYRARLLHEPPGIIQPAKVQDDANEQSLLKRLQRFFLGEQQHNTTAAALIETPLRIQPNQNYLIRIHIMGRSKRRSERSGLSGMVKGDKIYIEVRSALPHRYAYIVQRADVRLPESGYAAEVTVPMRPLPDVLNGRRERLYIQFMNEQRQPLYEKPFTIEIFVSHLVQAGREGHNVLPIPF